MDFETVIGLEVHAQLLSRSKLFCGCSTEYGAPPNTQTCPVCLALPGALPSPNATALRLAVQAGLALGCTVRKHSVFARKNYFYPDLPKGYQISQFELPLNEHGTLFVEWEGGSRTVEIQRIHVEEDAAKNLHESAGDGATLVDFNRGGTALIEIVSGPDMRGAEEAEAYLRKLRDILMFIGVNDGNLEEGSFRCDANVSIRPRGETKLGTRAELKNINSFRFVRKAIEAEVIRQEALVRGGGQVIQETRTWNEALGKTVSMRSKEDAHDYRYFPDPDLPTLVFEDAEIDALRKTLPELPEPKRKRYEAELGLTPYDAQIMTSHPRIADYFEETAAALASALKRKKADADSGKRAANFIQSEIMKDVRTDGLNALFPVTAAALAELLAMIANETISGKMAKDIYQEMMATQQSADSIVEKKGLKQVTDSGAIEAIVRSVLDAHPGEVEKYRAGKLNMMGFFVGQVMRASEGKANPGLVNQALKKLLES